MANLMIAMILPPVGKALPERKGIAVLLRLSQEVSRMAAAARIVVRLKDVLEAVEPADLSIRQGVGPKHFVRCHGHVRITVWLDELHHRSALEELQEAELQHVSVQLVDIVERPRERIHALARQANDEVDMQVHVVEREDAPDVRCNLFPVIAARDSLQCLLIRRLDADLELDAAARHLRQRLQDVFIEVIDGHLEVKVRAHRLRKGQDVLQDGQEMRLLGIKRPVDKLDLAHVVAHEEIELAKDARERQKAHSGRRTRQAVSTGERTATRCLIVEDALLDGLHLRLAVSKGHL